MTIDSGTKAVCSAKLNAASPDEASCTIRFATVGKDQITAHYRGDSEDHPSQSGPTTITIGKAATVTSLTASDAEPKLKQSVTFSATVTRSSPATGDGTGEVEVESAGKEICLGKLDGSSPDRASCHASFSRSGKYSVSARYEGDANDSPSTSSAFPVTVS